MSLKKPADEHDTVAEFVYLDQLPPDHGGQLGFSDVDETRYERLPAEQEPVENERSPEKPRKNADKKAAAAGEDVEAQKAEADHVPTAAACTLACW